MRPRRGRTSLIIVDFKTQLPPLAHKNNSGPLSLGKIVALFLCSENQNYKVPTMLAGITHWSNCSLVSKPNSTAASLKVLFSLCAFFAILAAFS